MKKLSFYIFLLYGLFLSFLLHGLFLGILPVNARQLFEQRIETTQVVKDINKLALADAAKSAKPSQMQPFEQVVKNTTAIKGLFTLYREQETGKIYLEVRPNQLNKNYLSTITMESGIGERGIYSGMPLQDFLFYFRRVNDNLHFVVRNVNFRTSVGAPQARSLDRSFSDSVLYALPIKSIHPQNKSILIDLGDLLLSDLPGLSSMLSSHLKVPFQLDEKKSYFGIAKSFPLNLEIESVYGFSSTPKSSAVSFPTLPDARALTLRVRYSLSQLPQNNNYLPRLADDRVGYFITAYKDFSIDNRRDPFVRYINRWHLEKQNPRAPLSLPKQPILFWIENAVPLEYRDALREGVLMWNQAFEKAGFKDAIQVRQMPDDAKWDPADVRYNTIRWINTVDGFFALGPSRVNPLTGEILDADILVDAGFVATLKQDYRNLVQQNQSQPRSLISYLISNGNLCNGGMERPEVQDTRQEDQATDEEFNSSLLSNSEQPSPTYLSPLSKLAINYDVCYGMEATNQLAIGSLAMSLFQNTMPNSDRMQEYIHQYLRLIIAHEVGHTLGLRHNFRGSTLLQPEQMNNTEITRTKGLTASVMDYIPPNLAPYGKEQGDYFPYAVGSYDQWAIQYGYSPTQAAHPLAEKRFLQQIAQLSSNPELAYATDEDMFDLDPEVNAWDNSGDVLQYSQWQLENAHAMWERLNKRYPIEGESYSKLSELFDEVFLHYLRHTHFITKYIGGQSFDRDHAGETGGQFPFEPVSLEKQRQALVTLQRYIFAEGAFDFPTDLLNKLAPSRWMHWGNAVTMGRLDYPIHDSISTLQSFVLRQLFSGDRLNRLRDIELKTKPGEVLTMPELFETLQNDIWTEVVQPNKDKSVQISSLRRALQREHLEVTMSMVLRTKNVPEDARTLAWYNLRKLRKELDKAISKSDKQDDYTKAHLEETSDRIDKTLNAQIQSR